MTSTITAEMHQGVMRKVETITYSNNSQVKRIFESDKDTIPFDIVWVKTPVHLDLWETISHREEEYYKKQCK